MTPPEPAPLQYDGSDSLNSTGYSVQPPQENQTSSLFLGNTAIQTWAELDDLFWQPDPVFDDLLTIPPAIEPQLPTERIVPPSEDPTTKRRKLNSEQPKKVKKISGLAACLRCRFYRDTVGEVLLA